MFRRTSQLGKGNPKGHAKSHIARSTLQPRRYVPYWGRAGMNDVDKYAVYQKAYGMDVHLQWRPSFWASDFKHRYLIQTGGDYKGQIPQVPAPGSYPGLSEHDLHSLGGGEIPGRESRHLPQRSITAKLVWEDFQEQKFMWNYHRASARVKLSDLRDVEMFEWYTKLQRVRGRWCREQGIASRGVYGPAIDAAEMWG